MFNSRVLEVTIGLLVTFSAVSLLASSIYEAFASLLKLRASSLLGGVKALLNDPGFGGLAHDIYNHALVNPGSTGTTPKGEKPAQLPSYIDAQHFAQALLDAVQKGQNDVLLLKAQIDKLPDDKIRQLLQGMFARAEGKVDNLRDALAAWFDTSMARLSGGYKRQAQLFTFLAALVLAGVMNIDAIRVFTTLWHQLPPASIGPVSLNAASSSKDALVQLSVLPVGWPTPCVFDPRAMVGWLFTASSVLFGAPFWFDLLSRVVNLRGAGQKPATKTDPAPAN